MRYTAILELPAGVSEQNTFVAHIDVEGPARPTLAEVSLAEAALEAAVDAFNDAHKYRGEDRVLADLCSLIALFEGHLDDATSDAAQLKLDDADKQRILAAIVAVTRSGGGSYMHHLYRTLLNAWGPGAEPEPSQVVALQKVAARELIGE